MLLGCCASVLIQCRQRSWLTLLSCGLPAEDGSKTGSGGKHDYEMETDGSRWQIEREPGNKDLESQVPTTSAARHAGLFCSNLRRACTWEGVLPSSCPF